ncbi:MAG: hypothetical protein H0W72_07180 [Planctomycetes bacterium]|nr:hypothetical protein [Planctomycetota bacterium]
MEENDKTYMWLMIIAFVALLVATGLALAELGELKQPLPSVDKFFE